MTLIALLTLALVQTPETSHAPSAPPSIGHASPRPAPLRPAAPPTKRGIGMLLAGAALALPVAVPMVTLGALQIAETEGCPDCIGSAYGRIVLPIGLVGFTAGVSLLTLGALRNSAWREWQRTHGVSLRVQIGRTYGAWTPGFALRF
ncbi:MAG: hypothetical protein KA978_27825 [Deltaproteobacteria bacterium]|jgi:hypothetical protein|nr:hypothetical protein [Deltaproteobacteria bacterium]